MELHEYMIFNFLGWHHISVTMYLLIDLKAGSLFNRKRIDEARLKITSTSYRRRWNATKVVTRHI